MGFTTLTASLFLLNIHILIASEANNQKYAVVSTTPPTTDFQDLKDAVSKLQNQLEIRTILNDLKDNINQRQETKPTFVLKDIENSIDDRLTKYKKEMETLLENKITNVKKNVIDEIKRHKSECQCQTQTLPTDCKDVQNRGNKTSGVYIVKPEIAKVSFRVWCDMTTRGGGWTYVINRFDGSQDFYLNWPYYKYGFGDITKEFWLGLEHLYELTNSKANELLVELVDWSDHKAYANYKFFEIGSESEGYYLKSVGDYSGDAGDSLRPDAAAKPKFSTKDKDQDQDARNCATVYPGAWWHTRCFNAHLMGKYRYKGESNLSSNQFAQGVHWKAYRGYYYSLKEVRMMIRPQDI